MITCKCGKTIHDEYEGVTYSFGPTIHGLVKKARFEKVMITKNPVLYLTFYCVYSVVMIKEN